TALALHKAGVQVVAIVDVASRPAHESHTEARSAGIEVYPASTVVRTHGSRGLTGITIGTGASRKRIACDLLCVSGGWSPTVHLHSQSGGSVDFDAKGGMFVPGRAVQSCVSVGAARGTLSLIEAMNEGAAAGRDAVRMLDGERPGSWDSRGSGAVPPLPDL